MQNILETNVSAGTASTYHDNVRYPRMSSLHNQSLLSNDLAPPSERDAICRKSQTDLGVIIRENGRMGDDSRRRVVCPLRGWCSLHIDVATFFLCALGGTPR